MWEPDVAFTPSRVQLRGIRVLVVDDESDAREALEGILRFHGAVVHSASSVVEALRLIDQEPLDVLLADIAMPGRDGYDLIRTIPEEEEPDSRGRRDGVHRGRGSRARTGSWVPGASREADAARALVVHGAEPRESGGLEGGSAERRECGLPESHWHQASRIRRGGRRPPTAASSLIEQIVC